MENVEPQTQSAVAPKSSSTLSSGCDCLCILSSTSLFIPRLTPHLKGHGNGELGAATEESVVEPPALGRNDHNEPETAGL